MRAVTNSRALAVPDAVHLMPAFDEGGSDVRRLVRGNGAGDAQNDAGHGWGGVRLWRLFAFVNEFPEVFGLAQDFIFPCGRGDVGAEQKVVQAVGVQNAMDDHLAFNDFKVDAVVPGYVAVKNFAILFHLAEAGVIKGLEGGFRDWKSPSRSSCHGLGMLDTSAALFYEDDLKHALF